MTEFNLKGLFMKTHYFLLLFVMTTLGGCSLLTESNTQSTHDVSAPKTAVKQPVPAMAIEETLASTQYPNTTFPSNIVQDELFNAMADYYQSDFTDNEKEASQQELEQTALYAIKATLKEDNVLSALNIDVDQIKLTLNQASLYVARLIIPMPFDDAEQLVNEHDILLMNHAFAQIGNRPVMIAYYNDDTHTLTPRHIASSTHSLFFSE